MDANVNGVMPVIDMNRGYGDGFGYGGGAWFMWIIVLFMLMGGNGGWGNNRGYATQADVYAANDMQDLKGNQRQIMSIGNNLGNGIADATFALNNNILAQSNLLQRDLMGGFANLGNAVNDGRFASQQCCCETNRNIDAVRYEGAQNTCAITTNATANTQKILDKLASMEYNAMKSENDNLRMALANERNINVQFMQTKDIIGAVRPFPVPAYAVGSPYGTAVNACPCAAYNA